MNWVNQVDIKSWLEEVFQGSKVWERLSLFGYDINFFKPFLRWGLKGYYSIYAQPQETVFHDHAMQFKYNSNLYLKKGNNDKILFCKKNFMILKKLPP